MLICLTPTSLLWMQQRDHSNRYRHILTIKITTLLRRPHLVMYNKRPNWWEAGDHQHVQRQVIKELVQLGPPAGEDGPRRTGVRSGGEAGGQAQLRGQEEGRKIGRD